MFKQSRKSGRSSLGKAIRMVEGLALFIIVPTALYQARRWAGAAIIPLLMALAVGCAWILKRDPSFDCSKFWNSRDFLCNFKQILARFLILAAALGCLTAVWMPERLFSFPSEKPWLWMMVMALYPLLSAYPQEVIYRTFFFHRYKCLFPSARCRIVLSGVLFGYGHLMFNNWIAPLFATLGGLLFAFTYHRTQSTLLASLEHALWGNWIFTVGLGWYFYGGGIH